MFSCMVMKTTTGIERTKMATFPGRLHHHVIVTRVEMMRISAPFVHKSDLLTKYVSLVSYNAIKSAIKIFIMPENHPHVPY